MTPKIELKNVHKRFGPKVVLDGIDLTINPGDSVVIIGGSGSGKSVTIKCVLGIIRPESGAILVDGEDVTRLRGSRRDAYLRKFGMLFQGAALFDSLPVWENVAFGLIQGRGVERKRAKEIAIEKLAKVGLGPEVGEGRKSVQPPRRWGHLHIDLEGDGGFVRKKPTPFTSGRGLGLLAIGAPLGRVMQSRSYAATRPCAFSVRRSRPFQGLWVDSLYSPTHLLPLHVEARVEV